MADKRDAQDQDPPGFATEEHDGPAAPQDVVGSEGGAAPWASPSRVARDGKGPRDRSPAPDKPPTAEQTP